jgi:CBS-domain-containing membrane protein
MKVSEIMTPNVISVDESVSVREVAQMLNRHRISGLPVCDDHGHMTGLITEYDLIAKSDARNAGEAMSRDVIAVMEDTSVDEVRFLLVHRKIKRVPVLRGQKLVGIVSRADLVREIALTWVCQVCGDSERGRNPPDRAGNPAARNAETPGVGSQRPPHREVAASIGEGAGGLWIAKVPYPAARSLR